MKDVEESPLSINQYFKEKRAPFSQAQYYLYKKILKEKGIEGLSDQRCEGNNLRFTDDMKNFVIGLLEHNRSMSTTYVRNAIKNRFEITISDTTIKDFRRENDLTWVRPKIKHILTGESGAAEIPITLALGTGIAENGLRHATVTPFGDVPVYHRKVGYIFSLEIFCYLRSVVAFTHDLRDIWWFLWDVRDQHSEYLT